MRTCMQGHRGCGYIGEARHESNAPKPPPTEAQVREIVREELDLTVERIAGALIKGLPR